MRQAFAFEILESEALGPRRAGPPLPAGLCVRARLHYSRLLLSFIATFQNQINPIVMKTLYERLGGYDAISAVVEELIVRLRKDETLGRFWAYRGEDGIEREKQLLKDFLANVSGGKMVYTGRDNTTSHRGMRITEQDWAIFTGHLKDTLRHFNLPEQEFNDVTGFIESTKHEIVEA
jgi:hemoglobin